MALEDIIHNKSARVTTIVLFGAVFIGAMLGGSVGTFLAFLALWGVILYAAITSLSRFIEYKKWTLGILIAWVFFEVLFTGERLNFEFAALMTAVFVFFFILQRFFANVIYNSSSAMSHIGVFFILGALWFLHLMLARIVEAGTLEVWREIIESPSFYLGLIATVFWIFVPLFLNNSKENPEGKSVQPK